MYKFVTFLQNTKGDALTVGAVAVVDRSTSARVPIYSDSGGTPIADNLGVPDTTNKGLVEFYVDDGIYHIDLFKDSAATQFAYRITDFPMVADLSGQVTDVQQALADAETARDAAEGFKNTASEEADAAAASAIAADAAKDDAETAAANVTAAQAALAADRIFMDTSAGLAGTTSGDGFFAPDVDDNLALYINNSGVADPTGYVMPGTAYLASAIAAANAAAANLPAVYTTLGEDGHGISSATVGATTPDTNTTAAGVIVLNIPASVQQGYIGACSVRLSATGTGKLVVVNYLTNKVVRTIANVTADIALDTWLTGAELGSLFLHEYETIAYQSLTGGRVRYVSGSNGRYINNADWDGSDGDSVTLVNPSATYAISYTLYPIARGATVTERVTQRRNRGAEGMSGLFDVIECYFDQPGNIQTNLASPGINDINLAAATNPNVTRTGYGVKLRSGLVMTPSITARTIVSLHRVDPDSPLAFIISGGTGATDGVTTNSVPAGETIHTTTGAGVCPIYRKSSNGSRAVILLSGGWMVVFRDMGASRTSIFGFGGRHSHASADRASEMDIGFVGASTLSFSDAQRATIADALARRYLDQGVRVFNRDCTEPVYGMAMAGDSSVEGRGRLYNGNATVTATTVQGSRDITVTAVTGTLMPQMSLTLASLPATAIIESQTSGTTGGAGVYRLTVAADATAGAGKTGIASHFGVEFDDTLIMAGTSQTVFRDLQPLRLGENQQNESAAALASPFNAGVAVGIARWRRANRLNRKKRVCVVTLTRGSSHICPFGAITAGVDPAPLFTYHPNAMEDSAAFGTSANRTLFDLFLEQWYRATAQARNRNIALQMDALVMPGGLQSTVGSAATGGSAAAFQGYMQAFFDAVKLYTGENPRPVVYQSQTGAGTDPTLTGYVRDGQLAFKNANAGAVLYDTDISVPASVNYAGAPHGLNAGDFHLNLYSVLKQGEAAPALLGWV